MRAALILCLLPLPALADPPKVVADIAPVAVLAGAVLGERVEPLVGPGDDPHHFQLRPSQARALGQADAILWIGPGLTPWLEKVIEANAAGARQVELAGVEGIAERPFQFGGHHHDGEADPGPAEGEGQDHADGQEQGEAHGHDHAGDGEHDHAGDGDHDHDHAGEQARDRSGAAAHDHDHGDPDPHVWLDPANDIAMIRAIAATLSGLDPAGAGTYAANAARAEAEVTAAAGEARAILAPHRQARLIVFHDAYAHWAEAFGMRVVAAIADGEAAEPGAAALAELRAAIAAGGADCIFVEAQHSPRLSESLAADTGIPTGRLDPMAGTAPGGWLTAMATAVDACLSQGK